MKIKKGAVTGLTSKVPQNTIFKNSNNIILAENLCYAFV